MTRMKMDCRTMPSESGCSLVIVGEPEEVLRAAAAHAVDVHGHTDDEALRDGLRSMLTEDADATLEPGTFLQLIAFRTQHADEMEALGDEWAAAIGADRTAQWGAVGADRNDPGRYVEVVAFPDYESAMTNSKHPATSAFAAKLAELAEGDAEFTDLDVHSVRRW
ncbi:DUF1059 domain-containing protein [Pseudonocardia sp. TRM90224]|uniref:DUF1059 domain-containing protein n=1 Tax=Pseudonocardia sp. TRM90224 TaxID=2812678 RepID=UPI001E3E244F|nr:DUF1059 domain-containing protein [Pseudonocardia sp. TRM90224]